MFEVECKVRFSNTFFNSNEPIELNVYLRVTCPDPITFSKLYVRFNLPSYNQSAILDNTGDRLRLEPNKIHKLTLAFLPNKNDIGRDLEVSSISLALGKREQRALLMQWRGDCRNALTTESHTLVSFQRASNAHHRRAHEASSTAEKTLNDNDNWHAIRANSIASIVARRANIELAFDHRGPMFVDELYAVRVNIANKENARIDNVTYELFSFSLESTKTLICRYIVSIHCCKA